MSSFSLQSPADHLPTMVAGLRNWRTGWAENGPLRLTVLFSIGLLVATIIGLLVDPRTLIGEPIWIKPTKFAISSIFYSFSLLWLLTYIVNRPRLVRIVSWVTAGAMFGELILISLQAFRGVRSHFNVATPFDTAVFSAMGTMILALWLASLAALIFLLIQPFKDRAWGIMLKWTLLATVIGSGLGFLMTSPRQDQLEGARATGVLVESGRHTVGTADGGAGLPFVGWSTVGGDLRIGHFFGLHALQVIPLLAVGALWLFRRRSEQQKVNLVHIVSLAYLGVIGLTTWQALRGEPLIYPSRLTLAVVGAYYLALLAAAWFNLSGLNKRPSVV